MPYSDPERKREHMREWRKTSIGRGYGQWLYKLRQVRFDDADRFGTALDQIVALAADTSMNDAERAREMADVASVALSASADAHARVRSERPVTRPGEARDEAAVSASG